MRSAFLALLFAALASFPARADTLEPVDLELILAIDVSAASTRKRRRCSARATSKRWSIRW